MPRPRVRHIATDDVIMVWRENISIEFLTLLNTFEQRLHPEWVSKDTSSARHGAKRGETYGLHSWAHTWLHTSLEEILHFTPSWAPGSRAAERRKSRKYNVIVSIERSVALRIYRSRENR